MDELDDIVREFLVESSENLDQLDRDMVALDKEPRSQEILSRVFRTIHTIKGTTGFLGFEKLESVTNTGESLLSRLRDGVQILNPATTSGLLAMVDAVREILSNIEATGREGEGDFTALVERLKLLQGDGQQAPPAPAPIESETP